MTNEDVQDPLNEVGVHFCLVSKQAARQSAPGGALSSECRGLVCEP